VLRLLSRLDGPDQLLGLEVVQVPPDRRTGQAQVLGQVARGDRAQLGDRPGDPLAGRVVTRVRRSTRRAGGDGAGEIHNTSVY
jgi:hypothetical protein